MGWWLYLTLVVAAAHAQETCLSVNENPYLLFGSKTAYLFANNNVPVNRIHDVPGCQPIAFWLAYRHGASNPTESEIPELKKLSDFKNNILNNYRSGNFRNTNQRICASDVNLISQWEWNSRINSTFAGNLTSEGYMTTQQQAQSWKQRYPGLLTDNPHDYLIKYVDDEISGSTFRAFTEGIFRTQAENYDFPKEMNEKKLKPYKSCEKWKNEVEDNNDTLTQKRIFQSKQEFREMITNVSLRLGFNYDIHPTLVYNMYQMCRYNKAWDISSVSPWCSVFTREDLKRYEYAEDLETFYKYGYASDLSPKVGCSMLNDMVAFLTKHAEHEQPQQPKAQIQLTDSEMLLMLLRTMGTNQDPAPLTGDNYHTNTAQNRKWSTSLLAPYNANFAAVLYKCTSNGNFQIKDRYQVLFLHNEKPVVLEGCRVGLCDWSLVIQRFGELANKCDLQFCNGAKSVQSWGIVALVTLVLLKVAL
ncbi:multiple inositol polyphosphate phosphatase 1-like isoform X2 [Plodia interpunctella]|nr:multiple inositol polyphosphate phosphatase 1-like isoform X2 [Plodia interpunctella]